MVRMVRISTALLFALMMMIATAGAAQAFNPPDNAPDGVGANTLGAPPTFPAWDEANDNGIDPPDVLGPWNAVFNPADTPITLT